MYGFISWIERKNADETLDVFFLTDKEVFSKRGRKLIGDFQHHDVLSHGSIRRYYGKGGYPLEGGLDFVVRDFWKAPYLPKAIKDLHPEDPVQFMMHWGRMWSEGFFQNYYLRFLIRRASSPWKAHAWERLMDQHPSKHELRFFVAYACDPWNARAWELLVHQHPSNGDLCYIVEYAPDFWKVCAIKMLIRQDPSNRDLCCIILYAPYVWKEWAWERLLHQSPSHDDFYFLIKHASDAWRERARVRLKKS